MHEAEKLSLQQIEKFPSGREEVRFEGQERKPRFTIGSSRLLCQQEYTRQGRRARGLLRRYLVKMTGSEPGAGDAVDRALSWTADQVQAAAYRRHRFPQRYTRADIELLATVDEAHEKLSGPATRRILRARIPPVRQARV